MACPSMWPKLFWSVKNGFGLTKLNWTWPKWNGRNQYELVWSKLWFSTKINHIWTWTIHFGRNNFILVVTKSLWSSPNQFGQTKTILDRLKLFWSHRRTRHKWSQKFCNFSASNFKTFSRSLEQFILTEVGQNNFGNNIPCLCRMI